MPFAGCVVENVVVDPVSAEIDFNVAVLQKYQRYVEYISAL